MLKLIASVFTRPMVFADRFYATLCLALLVAAACSPSTGKPADHAISRLTPEDGDSIIVRYESEPDTLNPINVATANGRNALYGSNWSQVYETLLQYDPDNKWSMTKPLLAE